MTELVLGTAQFGHGYGVTNDSKRIDDGTVAEILRTAVAGGIRSFDTADGYGDAQERVGRMMPSHARPQYISKFVLADLPTSESLFGHATHRLQTGRLQGLMFHRIQDLLDDRFAEALHLIRNARAEGIVTRFGVSVYDCDELELARIAMPDMDLVQIPGSIVDRRLLESPLLSQLRENGVEVHVRSAFLQGLLLVAKENLPAQFQRLKPVLDALDSEAARHKNGRLALLLGFLAWHENADAVVVGSTSVDELAQTLDVWSGLGESVTVLPMDELPLEVIDPRKWNQA